MKRINLILICFILSLVLCLNIVLGFASSAFADETNLESQDIITSNKSVLFDVFFENSDGISHSSILDISKTGVLKLRIKLKDLVVLESAKVKFDNPNFCFGAIDSPYVKKVDNHEYLIEICGMSTNQEIIVDIPITFDNSKKENLAAFTNVIAVSFDGIVSVDDKTTTASSVINISVGFTEQIDYDISSSYTKYFEEEDKVILMQEITEDLSKMNIPRSMETINIKIPQIMDLNFKNVHVIANGKSFESFTLEEDTLKLDNQNMFLGSSFSYKIVYEFEKQTQFVLNSVTSLCSLNVNSVFVNNSNRYEKEINYEQEIIPSGSKIQVNSSIIGDIYNGPFKNVLDNYEIEQKVSIESSILEEQEDPNLSMMQIVANDIIANEKTKIISSIYGIKLNSYNVISLFGEDFSFRIYNLNDELIYTITKQDINKKQEIDINFNEYENILIDTSNMVNIGILDIVLKKNLKINTEDKNYTNELKKINTINLKTIVTKNETQYISQDIIEVKKSKDEATLISNINNIATDIKQEIELKAVLEQSDVKYNLYKDPQILFKLPKQLQILNDLEVQIRNLEGDYTFEIDKESNIVLVKLTLEQKEYLISSKDNIEISLKFETLVDKYEISSTQLFEVEIINNNENYVNYAETEEKEEEVKDLKYLVRELELNIKNPKDIITKNEVKGIATTKDKFNENINYIELKRDIEEQKIEIIQEIQNNKYEKLENVTIIGNCGTNIDCLEIGIEDAKNNLDATIEQIILQNVSDYEIYYTKNDNANSNLDDENNEWTKEFSSDAKKYLIVIKKLENEKVYVNYQLNIPEKLDYNKCSYISYEINYMENEETKKMSSEIICLTTLSAAKLQENITLSKAGKEITSDSSVCTNDICQLEIELANIGKEDAKYISVNIDTNCYKIMPNTYNCETKDNVTTIYLEDITPSEMEKLNLNLKVKPDNDEVLDGKVLITYNDQEIQRTLTNAVFDSSNPNSFEAVLDTYANVWNGTPGEEDLVSLYSYNMAAKYILRINNPTQRTYENVTYELITTALKIDGVINLYNIDGNRPSDLTREGRGYEYSEITDYDDNHVYNLTLEPGNNYIEIAYLITDKAKEGENLFNGTVTIGSTELAVNQLSINVVDYYKFNISLSANEEDTQKSADDIIIYNCDFENNNESANEEMVLGKAVHPYVIYDEVPQELEIIKVYLNEEILEPYTTSSYEGYNPVVIENIDEVNKLMTTFNIEGNEEDRQKLYELLNLSDDQELDTILTINNNCLQLQINLAKGEKINLKIETKVKYNSNIEDNKKITNKIIGKFTERITKESRGVSHYIKRYEDGQEDAIFVSNQMATINTDGITEERDPNYYDEDKPIVPNTEGENGNQEDGQIKNQLPRYSISGIAFLDANKDGIYYTETTIKDIEIELQNLQDETIAKATTSQSGIYQFLGIEEGNYRLVANVPEEYIQTKVVEDNGGNKFSKQTNTNLFIANVKLDSNKNVNLGLIKKTNFIPQITKNLKKVTLINDNGTMNYTYDNISLGKIELDGNKLVNSQLLITYEIKIKNIGDAQGYVESLQDIIPNDCEFKSELNPKWKASSNSASYEEISDEKFKIGEEKSYEIVICKTIDKNSLGTIVNNVIAKTQDDENNASSSAKLIIGLKTGEIEYQIIIALLVILITLIYIAYQNKIELKIQREEKNRWNQILRK